MVRSRQAFVLLKCLLGISETKCIITVVDALCVMLKLQGVALSRSGRKSKHRLFDSNNMSTLALCAATRDRLVPQ